MPATRGVRLQSHRLIRAPVQRVWQLLSRPEIHPRYATMWMAADVIERSQGSAVVEFRGFFGGLPIVSVQRLALKAPWRLEFRQVRGELRDLSGSYVLKDVEGDTDLSCDIVVDAGIPLFSDTAVEQILAGHIEGTLGRIKTTAERDIVRLIGRRSRGGVGATTADEHQDGEEAAEPESPAASTAPDAADDRSADTVDAEPTDDSAEDEESPASVPPARTGQPGERRRRRRRRRGRRRSGAGPRPDAGGPAGAPPATV
jgi:hypothetical protein